MKAKTLWLTRTAMMTAVLIALQFATRPLGQLVTGSCVNFVLAVAVLTGGYWCGFAVALLSPFFAFLLGIGPALIAIVPAISLGNIVFISVLHLLCGRLMEKPGIRGRLLILPCAAVAAGLKFLTLYLAVTKLMLPLLALPEKQAAAMAAMFSLPQLITALIGGLPGSLLATFLKSAKK